MPARTEKKRNSGVRNAETVGLTPIAIPSGTAVTIPIRVPRPTRSKLAPIWAMSVPSPIDSMAAAPTAPTEGKTRGLIWNNGTTTAQIATSASSGATNIAAPASELTLRTIPDDLPFALVTCTSPPRQMPTDRPVGFLALHYALEHQGHSTDAPPHA